MSVKLKNLFVGTFLNVSMNRIFNIHYLLILELVFLHVFQASSSKDLHIGRRLDSDSEVLNSFSNYYTTLQDIHTNQFPLLMPNYPMPVSLPENVLGFGDHMHSLSHQKPKFPIRRGQNSHKEKGAHKDQHGHGWGENKEQEKDATLDDLTDVLGPGLFLLPFALKLVPFAIPALPLSYILSRYQPANLPELITRVMEFITQINELIQQGTASTAEG